MSVKKITQKFLRYLYQFKVRFFPSFQIDVIPPLQWMVNRLTSSVRMNYVDDILGHKMYLDEKDSLQLSTRGIYEPFETRFLQQTVKEGQVILDIGANIGYYTLLFARQVGPTGHVFAFEPDPQNFEILRRNIEINGYKNVTLVNQAVSNSKKILRLFLCTENRGDHRTYDPGDGRASIVVETVVLDDYLQSLTRSIDLVKMDIQGAEFYALQGMKGLLMSNPEVILVTEFWPLGLRSSGADVRAFLALLKEELGFSLFEIGKRVRALSELDIQHILDADPSISKHYNLVCSRKQI